MVVLEGLGGPEGYQRVFGVFPGGVLGRWGLGKDPDCCLVGLRPLDDAGRAGCPESPLSPFPFTSKREPFSGELFTGVRLLVWCPVLCRRVSG